MALEIVEVNIRSILYIIQYFLKIVAIYIKTETTYNTIANLIVTTNTKINSIAWMTLSDTLNNIKFLNTVNIVDTTSYKKLLKLLWILDRSIPPILSTNLQNLGV